MKNFLFLFTFLLPLFIQAQEESVETREQTSYERFVSQKGAIIKYTEYELDQLKEDGSYASKADASIRKVTINEVSSLYLQIQYKPYQSPEITAFVSYDDVKELVRALDKLIILSQTDAVGDASYVEQKFETNDFMREGYYIQVKKKKNEVTEEKKWFLSLDTRYRNASFYFNDVNILKNFFENAISTMDNIKAK